MLNRFKNLIQLKKPLIVIAVLSIGIAIYGTITLANKSRTLKESFLASNISPTPTSTPTLTPSPEPTTSPTVTPKPTLKPKPTNTPTPIPTPTPTITVTTTQSQLLVPPANVSLDVELAAGSIYLMASDGQYLGILSTNKFLANSILNEYGNYGSKFSATSIFNEYGQYGGQYSTKSPFNPYTTTPPKIMYGGNSIGYLTTNKFLSGAIDTNGFIGYLKSK